jgi:cytochrome c-type biogenesis protein CcmH/NrfG
MFNQNTTTDTKIAVLEERLSSYELLLKKIDEAIQIMGKTSQSISKMLAVHEEKIEQCVKTDDLIGSLIGELKEENKEHRLHIDKKMEHMEEKITEIDRIKWITVGSGVVLAVVAASISTLASGWWTPAGMETHNKIVNEKIK